MSFAHLKRCFTAVIRPKNRWLNPSFGLFNSSPLSFYVTKANNFAQPLMATRYSKADQTPHSLITFRSNSTSEPQKFTGGVYGMLHELANLLEKVKAMAGAGNKDEALELLRDEYEDVKEKVNAGFKGIEEALIIKTVARGYMDLGNLESVGPVMNKLMEIIGALKDGELFMDCVLVRMGDIYFDLGEFDKAVLVYQRGINILENRHEKNSSFLEAAYLGIANSFSSLGKSAKAIEFYRSAAAIIESSGGVESGHITIPLGNLGTLLMKEGKVEEAEMIFQRILNIGKKLFGEHDGKVGMAMLGLGTAKLGTDNVKEAICLFRNGLQVIDNSKPTGVDVSYVEHYRMFVAAYLHDEKRETESQEVLHEGLRISQKSGKEDLNFAKLVYNLGTSHLHSNDYTEAENFLRKCMEILAKLKSPQHEAVTIPMLPLAVTLHHLGRNEEAEKLALEALQIRENAFGTDSGEAAEALEILVLIQSTITKDHQMVLEKLEMLLKAQEKVSGNDCEEVRRTLEKMAYYLDKLGRKDEVLSLEKRLSMLSTKSKSPSKLFDDFWWFD